MWLRQCVLMFTSILPILQTSYWKKRESQQKTRRHPSKSRHDHVSPTDINIWSQHSVHIRRELKIKNIVDIGVQNNVFCNTKQPKRHGKFENHGTPESHQMKRMLICPMTRVVPIYQITAHVVTSTTRSWVKRLIPQWRGHPRTQSSCINMLFIQHDKHKANVSPVGRR